MEKAERRKKGGEEQEEIEQKEAGVAEVDLQWWRAGPPRDREERKGKRGHFQGEGREKQEIEENGKRNMEKAERRKEGGVEQEVWGGTEGDGAKGSSKQKQNSGYFFII